jgi:hypothetical protein
MRPLKFFDQRVTLIEWLICATPVNRVLQWAKRIEGRVLDRVLLPLLELNKANRDADSAK